MSSHGEPMPLSSFEPRPGTVEVAVALMRAGAVLTVLRAAVSLGGADTEQVEQYGVQLVVGSIAQVALWLWMARQNGAGRPWARTVATVLGCLSLLVPLVGAAVDSTATTVILAIVNAALGLVIVGLLHWPSSEPWFRDRAATP